ncbi:MAG: hypothetical protein WC758_08255 [Candidatus Woesearchaeota archaeon]
MIIFGGCLSLFIIMVGSMANDYDNPNVIDEEFQSNFDKFEETTSNAGEMYDAMNEPGGLSLISASELFFTAGFSVITLVFKSVGTASSILFHFPTYFGFSSTASIVMMTMLFAILTVLVVFSVINSLRGNRL